MGKHKGKDQGGHGHGHEHDHDACSAGAAKHHEWLPEPVDHLYHVFAGWLGFDAHPNAPAGGCGPGRSKTPGSLGTAAAGAIAGSAAGAIAHPLAPAARNAAKAAVAGATAGVKTPSGKSWHAKFPADNSPDALEANFRPKFKAFLKALKDAGATTKISSVFRPYERQVLIYWSWMIAKRNHDPRKIPAVSGIDIEWWHGDLATSKAKAQEMVDAYGTNHLETPPAAKRSRHTDRKAVDMHVSWKGTLNIVDANGKTVAIASEPRSSVNDDLIAVAKTYGVIHYINKMKDKPHWSDNGH